MLVSWKKSCKHAFSSRKKLDTSDLYNTEDLEKLVEKYERQSILKRAELNRAEVNRPRTPEPTSLLKEQEEAERRHFEILQDAENEAARQAEIAAQQQVAAVVAHTAIDSGLQVAQTSAQEVKISEEDIKETALTPCVNNESHLPTTSPKIQEKPKRTARVKPVPKCQEPENVLRKKPPIPQRLRKRPVQPKVQRKTAEATSTTEDTRRKSGKVILTPRAQAMAKVAQDNGLIPKDKEATYIEDSDDESICLNTDEPLAAGENLEEELLDSPIHTKPKISPPNFHEATTASPKSNTTEDRAKILDRRKYDQHTKPYSPQSPKEPDGFLLPFLIASGVDAPRAVRVAARLRDARCYNAQAFNTMIVPTLRATGLRMNEIKNLRDNARIALDTLEHVDKANNDNSRTLPRLVKQDKTHSQSYAPPSPHHADQQSTLSPLPRRKIKPRMDPTEWAKERRLRVLSARRRREIRLAE